MVNEIDTVSPGWLSRSANTHTPLPPPLILFVMNQPWFPHRHKPDGLNMHLTDTVIPHG